MPKRAYEKVRCDQCGKTFAVLKGQGKTFKCPNEVRQKAPAPPKDAAVPPKEKA